MISPRTLLILAAASLSTASQVKAVGRWSVSDIQRNMTDDKVTCNWSLNINQLEQSGRVTSCDFTVTDPINQACDLIQFSQACPGDSSFVMNGGHSGLGFVVLVLYNIVEDAKAYFGANDNALNYHADIPKQEKSAYPASTMDKRWSEIKPRDDGSSISTTRSWMVQNVTRIINPGFNTVSLDFLIQDTFTQLQVPCYIVVAAFNTNLETLDWSYQRCVGSEYSVSWGHTPVDDAGVMTVISSDREMSFFGFDNISTKQDLGSAGPNPVISF